MLTLRRARAPLNALRRGNATVAVEQNAAPPSPPPEAPKAKERSTTSGASGTADPESERRTKGRNRPLQTRRPFITLDRPREWNRPLAPGVLPAYDEALRVIKRDSERVLREARELERKEGELGEEERRRLEILRVQGLVNLPEVRWKARNGMGEPDLSQPVYRRLVEQRWRSDGDLDLLMERIHQMHVVPDILPSLHPSFDMRITFPELPPENAASGKKPKERYHGVEPGVFLSPKQTRGPPRIYTTVFHTDPRYYTMIMVDADYPDAENHRYKTFLHWMQPNIQLSTSSTGPFTFKEPHTPYIPPHPQRGTPYHRYVLLLLPHSSPSEALDIPVPTMEERVNFDSRAFMQKYGLDGSKGGAAHMWREEWDEEVSRIYAEVLKVPEPRYGYVSHKVVKSEVYQASKPRNKYVGQGDKYAGQGDRQLVPV
ncbi:PEBP-like protein [Gloeophyllum trabeum ATCC 11539]|uniref:PEBP-like protein n=1 Tax=Gloeophyllum trabeum (strain ATCC 11539 / FP-39264 / Madison 617) TaxID=670483 RepID=S7S180_GLOTA|nr:PEBP-like protein [Gloeophyllum trabeum ATCC 11539]EPQ61180.1 PEBP-like protein [Gloeophyllum trabeum ATCC 11539]